MDDIIRLTSELNRLLGQYNETYELTNRLRIYGEVDEQLKSVLNVIARAIKMITEEIEYQIGSKGDGKYD